VVHGFPGTVGISPGEEWCMVFLELLVSHLEKSGAWFYWNCWYLTLRRVVHGLTAIVGISP
jgi:hypothetical protein